MATFAITFGQRFPREEHPVFPEADHNGWVEVEATSASDATDAAYAIFGGDWSMVRPLSDVDTTFFPKGRLGVVVDGEVVATG